MRRRTFLSTLPAGALAAGAVAARGSPQTPAAASTPEGVRAYPYPDVGMGDRIVGAHAHI